MTTEDQRMNQEEASEVLRPKRIKAKKPGVGRIILSILGVVAFTYLVVAAYFGTPVILSEIQTYREHRAYIQETKSLKVLSPQTFAGLQTSGKPYLLYIGRKTCPDCRVFIPKLREVVESEGLEVYYMDTENLSEDMAKFIEDNDVNWIPTLAFVVGEYFAPLEVENLPVEEIGPYIATHTELPISAETSPIVSTCPVPDAGESSAKSTSGESN
ncbi:MAG: thioredoxin family protein [Eubacteriales bacterium]|nr:thioredoxin family protein [Eubacteriales bacterium]